MSEVGLHCPGCGHCLHLPSGHTVGLTTKQRRVLSTIADLIVRNEQAPTYEEVAQELGNTSKGNVCRFVDLLRKGGFLVQSGRGRARGLALTPDAWTMFGRDEKGETQNAA